MKLFENIYVGIQIVLCYSNLADFTTISHACVVRTARQKPSLNETPAEELLIWLFPPPQFHCNFTFSRLVEFHRTDSGFRRNSGRLRSSKFLVLCVGNMEGTILHSLWSNPSSISR